MRLVRMLESAGVSGKWHAARAFGRIGPEARTALFPLRRILRSKDLDVRDSRERDLLFEASFAFTSIDPNQAAQDDAVRKVVEDLYRGTRIMDSYEALKLIERFDPSHRPAYAMDILVDALDSDDEKRRDQAREILGQ